MIDINDIHIYLSEDVAKLPHIRQAVIDGLIEKVQGDIEARANVLADSDEYDYAYALEEELAELCVVRAWLKEQRPA